MGIIKIIFKLKWVFIGLALVLVIIFFGQHYLNKSKTSSQKQITSKAIKGDVTSTISASGTIQTANYLAVTTSANGIVKKVYVTEGTQVIKGQKIMDITLDSEGESSYKEAYASYLKAKNSVESAKNNLYSLETALLQKKEAFRKLKETNTYQSRSERLAYAYAENDYLAAENAYAIQESSVAQAEIALQSAYSDYQSYSPTVTATADGVIANIVATEGTKIENSVSEKSVETVASIKQEGTPTASLDITELDINNVKVGQKVKLTLSSISGQTFDGSVTGIDKIGSESSGVSNYPVVVKFDTDNDKVLPNMSVTAEIIIESHENALYVPTSAINTSDNEKYVNILREGTTQKTTIKTGINDGTNTEILEGLDEGDEVIVNTLPTSGFTSTSSTSNSKSGMDMMGGGPPGM